MSVASPMESLEIKTMNKTTTIIGVIAVVALLVGIWAKVTPATVITGQQSVGAVSNTNGPAAGTVMPNGTVLPNPTVYDYLIARTFLYTDKGLGYGNTSGMPVYEQAVRQVMALANNVPCALQNPFNATTTFQNLSAQITVGTSTTGLFSVGTSTTATATSTSIGTETVTSGQQGTLTFSGSAQLNIVGPSQYITFGVQGATFPFTYVGSCKAIFVTTT